MWNSASDNLYSLNVIYPKNKLSSNKLSVALIIANAFSLDILMTIDFQTSAVYTRIKKRTITFAKFASINSQSLSMGLNLLVLIVF